MNHVKGDSFRLLSDSLTLMSINLNKKALLVIEKINGLL
jgi:hypothetical protein